MDFTFDLATAYRCAVLSQRAYQAPNLTTPLAHVLVEEDADYFNIAVRGTKNLRDLITDSDFRRVPMWTNCNSTVHHGFKLAVDSIVDDLWAEVLHARKPVRLMGHSLGASTATQLALRLLYRHITLDSVYTFGEPRGGNAAYADECDERFGTKHHRVIHQEDIVCRIPGWLIGYRHSGHEDFLPSLIGGVRPAIWFDPGIRAKAFSDLVGIWRAWRAKKNIGILEDSLVCHHVDGYVSALANLLTQSLAGVPKV